MRLLLDTTVLLDIVLDRKPFANAARKVMIAGFYRDVELWAAAKSLTDVFYVARKAKGHEAAYRTVKSVVDEVSLCSTDGTDIQNALEARWPDFEDCVIYQAALKTKSDYIITRNAEDFSRSSIPTMSPTEFIDFMESELHLCYYEMEH